MEFVCYKGVSLIASGMGLSKTGLKIIRNHHRVADGEGNPS